VLRPKEFLNSTPIPDVDLMVDEAFSDLSESIQVPGCVSRFAEEFSTHVVVEAMNNMPFAIKMFYGF
jgi:hypothetical protein